MSGDLSGAGNFEPELRELREEVAQLKKLVADLKNGRDQVLAESAAAKQETAQHRKLLSVAAERLVALETQIALGPVKILADSEAASTDELVRLCNEARDVANRNAQVASTATSLLEKALDRAENAEAEIAEALDVVVAGINPAVKLNPQAHEHMVKSIRGAPIAAHLKVAMNTIAALRIGTLGELRAFGLKVAQKTWLRRDSDDVDAAAIVAAVLEER